MANEIAVVYATGKTLYYVADVAAQRWNGAALEALNAAHWSTYSLALAETAGTGKYLGSLPPALLPDVVAVTVYLQAGGSPAATDTAVLTGSYSPGVTVAPAGLDLVVVEAGLNARQALSLKAAALAGQISGAATSTVTISGAGVSTTRIVATTDASGNRTAVTLTPPA